MLEKTLDRLENGESGEVTQVLVAGKIKRRLVEMGITPGTRVTVTKRAPLGDPTGPASRWSARRRCSSSKGTKTR